MKYVNMGASGISGSAIAIGCMRIADLSVRAVTDLIDTSLSLGINVFDHADIYGGGRSEELFGKALAEKTVARDKLIIQSKCGIRPGFFDLSREHIIKSAEGILSRLGLDYLDIFLLHRPDTLMEPDEIAEAFDRLQSTGKARCFGVSNMNPAQMDFLQSGINQKLIVNQLQLSAAHTGPIDTGLYANMAVGQSVDRDGNVLEYCRKNSITMQTWSPLQYGFFEGTFLENERYAKLNAVLNRIAQEKSVTAACVAIAWILRHPAHMQAVVGSTNLTRISEMAKAGDVKLTRPEWYEIYQAAGNKLP